MKKKSYNYNNSKIFIVVLILIMVLSLYRIISSIITSNFSSGQIVDIIIIIIIISTIYTIYNKNKKYKEIIKKGIIVPGLIVRPDYEWAFEDDIKPSYYLYVKYMDPKTNQEKEFKTDNLSFNPYKKIKSTKCNVYIYNDTVIAEDFEFVKNKNERIFKLKDTKNQILDRNILIDLAIIMVVISIIIIIYVVAKNV